MGTIYKPPQQQQAPTFIMKVKSSSRASYATAHHQSVYLRYLIITLSTYYDYY